MRSRGCFKSCFYFCWITVETGWTILSLLIYGQPFYPFEAGATVKNKTECEIIMNLFPFIPLFVGTIVETSRFILRMVQAIRISDLFSSGESLRPVELLRKIIDTLMF